MTKALVLASDHLDGVCSAAVVSRLAHFKNMQTKIELFNYGNLNEILEAVLQNENTVVFILDLPPSKVAELEAFMKKLGRSNNLAYWNSHHPEKHEVAELVSKYFKTVDLIANESNKCAAELVQQKFMAHDEVALRLAALARDQEFWERKDEMSTKLADMIQAGHARSIIDPLSRGVYWTEGFEEQWKKYLERKQKELEYIVKRCQFKVFVNFKFCFTHASNVISSAEAGQKMLEATDCDVSCVVFSDGGIFFRRKQGIEINLRKLAEIFGGGGQKYASGGILPLGAGIPKTVTAENWKDILYFIERKIADYFDSTSDIG